MGIKKETKWTMFLFYTSTLGDCMNIITYILHAQPIHLLNLWYN